MSGRGGSSGTWPIELAAPADTAVVREAFEACGRVHVPGLFQRDVAARIHQVLTRETPWQLSLNPTGSHMDLGVEDVDQIPEPQRALVLQGLHRGEGFRYVFNTFPIHDIYHAGTFPDHPLMQVYEFLNSPGFLDFVRAATGLREISWADAQATRYLPGHFLTAHDDEVAGKNRLAAYVIGFTPRWRADLGGVLQFLDADGHVAEGYVPAFNALNLLRVPQMHCVSYVVPGGGAGRFSITGWLRSGDVQA